MSLHLEDKLKAPALIEVEGEADPGAEPFEDMPQGRAMEGVRKLAARRSSGFVRFAGWVFGSLFALVLTVSAWNFVTGLLAANAWLGWLASVLLVLAAGVVLVLVVGELRAFARLARLDSIRAQAIHAAELGDLKASRAVLLRLESLYAGRASMAWARARLAERQDEVFDADAMLRLAEVELILPLDALARAEVEAAARQVATVTALIPLALADVATALVSNLRMIRRVAEIYGGRAGSLGSWRLLRRVFVSLVATGAVALTDDMIGSFAGGGILSRLSRRFGEGVVNGALTARIGLTAMEICRPLPFVAAERPGVSATVSRAMAGIFGQNDAG
ncbi:MAG: YcjF family protein [Cypionkella sp.]